jgi:ubiquinone/menaquinone biosynthesis C-methylase UbiE
MERSLFFDQLAAEDDPLAIKPEHEPRMERLRRRLGELRGKRVFEPGCGAGPLTRRLAEWVGPYGRVLALDSCEGMTARCERVVNGHGHVEVRRGFAENEVLEEKAWDLVLCFRLYPHLDNPMKFLQQCRRGLVPEGDLVVANLEGSASLNALHAGLHGVHNDRMPSGDRLAALLAEQGWRVEEAVDTPEEYFVRARPD